MKHQAAILALIGASPFMAEVALFLGMMIEGDLFLFTAGFLVHRGELELIWTVIALFTGTIFGDSLWYLLGRTNTDRNRFLRWLGRTADLAGRPIDNHVQNRTFRTLFISKFVYGAHHFTIVRAARVKVPYLKFLRDDAIGSFFWIAIVGTLGYLASASFAVVRGKLRFVEMALLLAVALFFIISELVSRFLKKEL